MYAMLLTFGFGAMLGDYYTHPPRVLGMLALVFYVLYVRRP